MTEAPILHHLKVTKARKEFREDIERSLLFDADRPRSHGTNIFNARFNWPCRHGEDFTTRGLHEMLYPSEPIGVALMRGAPGAPESLK